MPIFENEFPTNPREIKRETDAWQNSEARQAIRDALDYFRGDNVTIRKVQKLYWADPKEIKLADGSCRLIGGGLQRNPYVSNHKIGYGVFADVVSQKINTLLNEVPIVESDHEFPKQFMRGFGYAMKNAGDYAAATGSAYLYEDWLGRITTFEPDSCIPYYSEYDGRLVALIRYWDVPLSKGNRHRRFVETYTEEGLTVYRTPERGGTSQTPYEIFRELTPYRYKKLVDFMGEQIIPEPIGTLPIVEMKNNEAKRSDLIPSLRSKIDVIDILTSGFANNIEDFSELFWVVKDAAGMGGAEFQDFIANINRTKKLIVGADDEVSTHRIEIPHEARGALIKLLVEQIVEETGIMDVRSLTGSSLTNVAIKASTMKLRQRVADFEWGAYETATNLIKLYQAYTNQVFEFDIEFQKLLLENETEIIDNMNKIRPDISRETYLEVMKRTGLISDVAEELRRIQEEAVHRYSVDPFLAEGEE